ncbi:hypothetical protein BDZ97DRAFT_1923328 [Flammula alnicola]|nr:hypothetical protein BDZ97DRAFT_1923328 [Flammula alnicola]
MIVRHIVNKYESVADVASRITSGATAHYKNVEPAVDFVLIVHKALAHVNTELSASFRQQVADKARETFMNHWSATFQDQETKPTASFDARALSAYVGHLTATEYISYSGFKAMTLLLAENFRTTLHLDCIFLLIRPTTLYKDFIAEPTFLLDCLTSLHNRCGQYINIGPDGSVSQEEIRLQDLTYELLVQNFSLDSPHFFSNDISGSQSRTNRSKPKSKTFKKAKQAGKAEGTTLKHKKATCLTDTGYDADLD